MNFKQIGFRFAALCGLALVLPNPASFAETPQELVLHYDFQNGSAGWLPAFTDYDLKTRDMRFIAETRALPDEIDNTQRGFYVQGMNRSDDLFMFLKREINHEDGLQPNTAYRVSFEIGLASNAPSGAIGIGGAPGESVYMKAGMSLVEPVPVLVGSFLEINVDKGQQSNGGENAVIVGDIANGTEESKYVYIERKRDLPSVVRTDQDGVLWAIVGTDSGFEGLTGLYYHRITIKLTPVLETQSQESTPIGLRN